MRYNTRIKKLSKKINETTEADSEVVIDVQICNSQKFIKDYSTYMAKRKLGMIKLGGATHIFACHPETKEKYENLSIEQAKSILKKYK